MVYVEEPLKPLVANVKLDPTLGEKTIVDGLPPLGVLHLIKPGISYSTPLKSVIRTLPIISFP